jgi:hypothetical protein
MREEAFAHCRAPFQQYIDDDNGLIVQHSVQRRIASSASLVELRRTQSANPPRVAPRQLPDAFTQTRACTHFFGVFSSVTLPLAAQAQHRARCDHRARTIAGALGLCEMRTAWRLLSR